MGRAPHHRELGASSINATLWLALRHTNGMDKYRTREAEAEMKIYRDSDFADFMQFDPSRKQSFRQSLDNLGQPLDNLGQPWTTSDNPWTTLAIAANTVKPIIFYFRET